MLNATCDLPLSEQPEIEVDARATQSDPWWSDKAGMAEAALLRMGFRPDKEHYRGIGCNIHTYFNGCGVEGKVTCFPDLHPIVGVVTANYTHSSQSHVHSHRDVDLWETVARVFVATHSEAARAETGGV